MVAQALAAALRTVSKAFQIHSLHAYFLRPALPTLDLAYHVARVRDGASFATREVRATQVIGAPFPVEGKAFRRSHVFPSFIAGRAGRYARVPVHHIAARGGAVVSHIPDACAERSSSRVAALADRPCASPPSRTDRECRLALCTKSSACWLYIIGCGSVGPLFMDAPCCRSPLKFAIVIPGTPQAAHPGLRAN